MAHILFRSSAAGKSGDKHPPVAVPSANTNAQPIIIDLAGAGRPLFSGRFAVILIGLCASFMLASLIALFAIAGQMNGMLRDALKAPAITAEKEPESAFPATLTPMPSKALIIGKDFQQARDRKSGKVELLPMLEKLPLYGDRARNAPAADIQLEVETAGNINMAAGLQRQADDAVNAGDLPLAIGLYAQAIRLNPEDDALRSNYVALLLEDARSLDEQGEDAKAVQAYKKALSVWRGNRETAAAIRARMEYLLQN